MMTAVSRLRRKEDEVQLTDPSHTLSSAMTPLLCIREYFSEPSLETACTAVAEEISSVYDTCLEESD